MRVPIAEILHNAIASDQLVHMADGYDALANRMEELEIKKGTGATGDSAEGARPT
jgi:hypothetical protein